MNSMNKARKTLAAARKSYLEDMRWLRTRFGIIREPENYATKEALLAALDAIEKNDPASLMKAAEIFQKLHRSIMARVIWDMLEQTKLALKTIRRTSPTLFEQKRKLWNKASWLYTSAAFLGKNSGYRAAIRLVSRI